MVGSGRDAVECICSSEALAEDRSGELSSDGKFRSWSTTWPPTKPQPPNTRTVPRDLDGRVFDIVSGIIAVVAYPQAALPATFHGKETSK